MELVPLPDAVWLTEQLKAYANPKARIGRLVRDGRLIRLKQGRYLDAAHRDDPDIAPRIANWLYGPSYVSFAWALRWYGLIPEDVPHVTSATFGRRRTKRFDTPVGSFFYRDVPKRAYPRFVSYAGARGNRFLVASAEKALCDELYSVPSVRSDRELQRLLYEDLRIDEHDLEELDSSKLIALSGLYSSRTLSVFGAHLGRMRSRERSRE